MKKILAGFVGVALSLQFSVAFAAVSSLEPAVQSLLGFNRWLHANGDSGIKYLNDNFNQALIQAQTWDASPQFGFVSISYQAPGPAKCVVEFGSVNKPKEVYKVECIDTTKINLTRGYGVKVPSTLTAADFFGTPVMRQRDFVTDIFSTPEMMKKLREYMHGTSTGNLDFTLAKQNGDLWWKLGISDGKQHGMHISADAMDATPKVPLVFEGN